MINIESTHIDPESGRFEVKIANWSEPLKFLVGDWRPDYMNQIDEFVLSHPDVTGKNTRPSEYHLWNPVMRAWDLPAAALDRSKSEKWAEIKKARSQAEWSGFEWGGSVFDSDPASQQRLASAVTLSQISSDDFAVDWVLKNNTSRVMRKNDLIAAGAALGVHVAGVFSRSQVLRRKIEESQSVEEVLAVTWN